MRTSRGLTVAVVCLWAGLVAGCGDKNETSHEMDRAGHSVQKAYDSTTNALKDVVEGVNEAVY